MCRMDRRNEGSFRGSLRANRLDVLYEVGYTSENIIYGYHAIVGKCSEGGLCLRIFCIGLPLASSSMSLSRYRISRMIGSLISSTRTPQITPLISRRVGWGWGASVKNVSKSVPFARCASNSACVYPVSQRIISSTSSFVRADRGGRKNGRHGCEGARTGSSNYPVDQRLIVYLSSTDWSKHRPSPGLSGTRRVPPGPSSSLWARRSAMIPWKG